MTTCVLFHLEDHRQISLHFKADFFAFEANWKVLQAFWNKLKRIYKKKDETISEFASKFEVNFKWIWKKFEENSSLNKLHAQCRSGTQGKNKGRLIFKVHTFYLVKKKKKVFKFPVEWIPNTVVTRVLVKFW